jgi:hypothetical protein
VRGVSQTSSKQADADAAISAHDAPEKRLTTPGRPLARGEHRYGHIGRGIGYPKAQP